MKYIVFLPFYMLKYLIILLIFFIYYIYIVPVKLVYHFITGKKVSCKFPFSFRKSYSISKLDRMEGHQFEYACADILKSNGFKKVQVTQSSGDYGVDIIAEKKGIRYAIQCKCYSNKLNNKPIQEVIGGLAYYGCDKGSVMTNQYFTEPAKRLAAVNGVELWDRDVLISMLSKTRKRYPKSQNEQYEYSENSSQITLSDTENDIDENSTVETLVNESNKSENINNIQSSYDNNKVLNNDNLHLSSSSAERISILNDLEEYSQLACDFLDKSTLHIQYFFILKELQINCENIEVLFESNEIIYELSLGAGVRVANVKNLLKELADYCDVEYIEYVYPTSTPRTIGLKIPMPEHLKKTSKYIYEANKGNEK